MAMQADDDKPVDLSDLLDARGWRDDPPDRFGDPSEIVWHPLIKRSIGGENYHPRFGAEEVPAIEHYVDLRVAEERERYASLIAAVESYFAAHAMPDAAGESVRLGAFDAMDVALSELKDVPTDE